MQYSDANITVSGILCSDAGECPDSCITFTVAKFESWGWGGSGGGVSAG